MFVWVAIFKGPTSVVIVIVYSYLHIHLEFLLAFLLTLLVYWNLLKAEHSF